MATTTTMSSTRDVNVGLGAAVCEEADLRGTVSFGGQAVVHPSAAVHAIAAPIVVGDRTIIDDHARIEHADPDEIRRNAAVVMTIGDDNIFESGCVIRSARIGHGNWFEPKARTEPGSIIGNNCLIGSGVVIARGEHVPDNTIVVCIQPPGVRREEEEEARGGSDLGPESTATPPPPPTRLTRPQKDHLLTARATLTRRYLEAFLDPKSPYALAKSHRLVPIVQRP